MSGGVAVVGSTNLDLVSLDRFPQPGETVLGRRLEEVAGGKGLNQGPTRDLPTSLLEACDSLVVNMREAQALLGDASTTDPSQLATRLAGTVRSIVLTVGACGAYVGTAANGTMHVPGRPVRVVDTTGAGDEFAGVLAAAMTTEPHLVRAAHAANRAAASVVAHPRSQRQAHRQFRG